MMDDLLIVGGLVPSLIIDQAHLGEDVDPHVGTMDLDVGLQVALLNEGRYRQLTERLRDAGFAMDRNDAGNPTRQRWVVSHAQRVTIDFLIQPTLEGDKGGKLRDLEPDFAAIIAPGLRCAFRDRTSVTLIGTTIFGEKATRDIWVCDAGAYVVLKALAFDSRGANKDAYDLYYVVRNYGAGPTDVASKLRPLLDDTDAQRALARRGRADARCGLRHRWKGRAASGGCGRLHRAAGRDREAPELTRPHETERFSCARQCPHEGRRPPRPPGARRRGVVGPPPRRRWYDHPSGDASTSNAQPRLSSRLRQTSPPVRIF
jgi:hypothetical protein